MSYPLSLVPGLRMIGDRSHAHHGHLYTLEVRPVVGHAEGEWVIDIPGARWTFISSGALGPLHLAVCNEVVQREKSRERLSIV